MHVPQSYHWVVHALYNILFFITSNKYMNIKATYFITDTHMDNVLSTCTLSTVQSFISDSHRDIWLNETEQYLSLFSSTYGWRPWIICAGYSVHTLYVPSLSSRLLRNQAQLLAVPERLNAPHMWTWSACMMFTAPLPLQLFITTCWSPAVCELNK